jgi:hypothetical protein
VPLQGGHFSVLLGQVTPLTTMDWSQPRWLSVQVGSNPELAPRQQITSVPLAITAERLADPSALPPPPNLLRNSSFEAWESTPYPVLRDWTTVATVSAWDVVKQETGITKIGQTSAKLIHDGMGHHGNVNQQITDVEPLRGHPVTLSAWAHSRQPRQPCLEISDGITSSSACPHSGNGTWEYLTVTHQVRPDATQVTFSIQQTREGEVPVQEPNYIDGAMAVRGSMSFAYHQRVGPLAFSGDGNVGIGTSEPDHLNHKLVIGSNLHGAADGIALDGVFTFYWGSGVPTPPATWIVYMWLDTDGALKVKFSNGVVRTIASPN